MSGNYYLTNDIDCSATSSWNSGAGFISIGNSSSKFTGSFDGQNYNVTGLYQYNGSNYQGVFGFINGATIQNVQFTDLTVKANDYIGGLVGYSTGTSYITNVFISGSIRSFGGANDYAGGLVGYTDGGLTITSCHTSGSVAGGGWYLGGLVGLAKGAYVVDSSSASSVFGDDYIGGLIGKATNSTTIIRSYVSGSVQSGGSGDSWTGGLVGYLSSSNIYNCYALREVTGTKYIGGLVGTASSSTITNSYSVGAVSGNGGLGGLIGSGSSTVTSSYWDTQTSGLTSSSGGTGKITAQMKLQSTFSDWDFSSIWYMPSSGDYPRLRWQLPTCTGCAVLSGDVCVAGSSCSGELPICSVSENSGICVCNAGSCNDGRICSGSTCVNCDASEGCGACGCGTSQKPTGAGSCLIANFCCAGECNVATGADSCSYSDDLCPDSACNRTTLSCCATALPYWRSSACKACSSTSGLSGTCTTQGMTCSGNYNCVPCNANEQCTCDIGEVADGLGNCVTPVCSDDSECGVDQCINAGEYNAFCSDCSSYNQIWYETACASCPADAVYTNGICLCNDGKIWNRSINTCFERGIMTSSGDLINLKRNNSNSATGRYDRIKSRMNRIRSKILDGTGSK